MPRGGPQEQTVSLSESRKVAQSTFAGRDGRVDAARSRGRVALALLRHDAIAAIALLFLAALLTAALLMPLVVSRSATTMNLSMRNKPPAFIKGGSSHLLGTDPLGRDLLVQIVLAARVSLGIAAVVVAVSIIIGTTLGTLAGYYGGNWDDVMMRLVDVVMGFPSLLLALVIIYALGPGIVNLMLVLIATRWVLYTRVVRADVLKLRRFEFVEAAHSMGAHDSRIMVRHVFPNLIATLVTLAILEISSVILAETALSFLGLGVPGNSWGRLIADGRNYITSAWWIIMFPGLAIFLTTSALAVLANWMVILLDPSQRARVSTRFQARRSA